ncbi:MAG: formylglycine-generating enzyme family protein, partial [Planctomycetota bacterium]
PSDLDDPIRQLEDNMVRLEVGKFARGSKESDDEQPIREVKLDGFEIGAMPVTQAQYLAIMGENPSLFTGDDLPVESVSWKDAMDFCRKLSKKTGRQYTLPSEAQWEYACRAGSSGRYGFGDDASQLDQYAWYTTNSKDSTHPVGRKKPNDWGLYDMHGNVWEWCLDHSHDNYDGAPCDGSAWQDLDAVSPRVFRGSSWSDSAESCRCSSRSGSYPGYRGENVGFRVVLVPMR